MTNILLFIFYSILILILINFIGFGWYIIRKNKKPPKTLITNNSKIESIEYSKQLLEFTRGIISDYIVSKFKEFTDNTDMEKVAKPNLQKLISELTIGVYEKININNILFEYTLFTKEYYEEYIIQFTINLIKQLTENYFNNQ